MGKVFDRLLLFVYSLAVAVGAIALLLTASALMPLERTSQFLRNVYYDVPTAYTVIILSVALFLISIRFFYLTFRRGRGNVPSIDQRTDLGDIRISIETVENLSLKAASRIRGIKELKSRVQVSDAGLEIVIRTVVDGESAIPDLSEGVQRSVKDHVEAVTGIPVSNVSVFVANVASSQTFKSRVE